MNISAHAHQRIDSRGLQATDIAIVRKHGRKIHRSGMVFYFMGKRWLPKGLTGADRERLEGVTIVCCAKTHTVVTAYKNKEALRNVKKKGRRPNMRYSH